MPQRLIDEADPLSAPSRPLLRPSSLNQVSVRLERGKRIALIGESGSGKSTLLSLLRGLYEPNPLGEQVRWSVDGNVSGTLPWQAIGQTVTLFPQEPEIFENTVAYNITLGLPFADEEVRAVCDLAHFSDVARHLPNGLETPMQEKGLTLSGGQKQRLALARGILAAKQSDIVLMDEPTSSIDPKTEFMIYHGLLAEFTDKAVVSSLHRLHLLPMFDYIYILRNGSVIDEGTFPDLRQRSAVFGEMWAHQEKAMETARELVG